MLATCDILDYEHTTFSHLFRLKFDLLDTISKLDLFWFRQVEDFTYIVVVSWRGAFLNSKLIHIIFHHQKRKTKLIVLLFWEYRS